MTESRPTEPREAGKTPTRELLLPWKFVATRMGEVDFYACVTDEQMSMTLFYSYDRWAIDPIKQAVEMHNAAMTPDPAQPEAAPAAERDIRSHLHALAMNARCDPGHHRTMEGTGTAYREGHRDARHAIAEPIVGDAMLDKYWHGAVDRVGEGARLQCVRCPEPRAVPLADFFAHLGFRDLKFQQAFGANGRSGLFVGYERRRAAEVAALRDALWIEHRNRPAGLAFHRLLLGFPAAMVVVYVAKRRRQLVFLNWHARLRHLNRRDRAAKRTHESVFGWVPLRLASARRACISLIGCNFCHVVFVIS